MFVTTDRLRAGSLLKAPITPGLSTQPTNSSRAAIQRRRDGWSVLSTRFSVTPRTCATARSSWRASSAERELTKGRVQWQEWQGSAFARVRSRSLARTKAKQTSRLSARARTRANIARLPCRRSWVRVPSSALKVPAQNSRCCRLDGQRFKLRGKVEVWIVASFDDGSQPMAPTDHHHELLLVHRAVSPVTRLGQVGALGNCSQSEPDHVERRIAAAT